jgi:hypothetical protein
MTREMMAELMVRWRGLRWSREDEFGQQGDDGGGGNGEAKRRQWQWWLLYRAEKIERRLESARWSR